MTVFRWWMVHGVARSGTSFMLGLIQSCSRKWISDWGLDDMLRLTPSGLDYIQFDREQALRDISNNILDNAHKGGGHQLDFVFKQADIMYHEYSQLINMWGLPERIIFCFRDPSGYMTSAMRHWPQTRKELRQRVYIETLRYYEEIGGDVFEYKPTRTIADYVDFLSPLTIDENRFRFEYKGKRDLYLTSEEMWEVYEDFRQKYVIGP